MFNDINSSFKVMYFQISTLLIEGIDFRKCIAGKHSLRYFKYNLFNFTTVFGNINYSKTSDPVVNRAYFNKSSEWKVNASFENESVNGIVGYQRSFMKYYKASVNLNLNWSKFNS
jgi:hypothetical protein